LNADLADGAEKAGYFQQLSASIRPIRSIRVQEFSTNEQLAHGVIGSFTCTPFLNITRKLYN
jgi:hypothetical protein